MEYSLALALTKVHLYRDRVLLKFEEAQSSGEPNYLNFTRDNSIIQVFKLTGVDSELEITLSGENLVGKTSENFNRVSLRLKNAQGLVFDKGTDGTKVTFNELELYEEEDLSDEKPKYWIIAVIVVCLAVVIAGICVLCCYCKKRQEKEQPSSNGVEQEIYQEIELRDLETVSKRRFIADMQSPETVAKRVVAEIGGHKKTSSDPVTICAGEQLLAAAEPLCGDIE